MRFTKAEIAEREERVARLHKQGLSAKVIAERTGIKSASVLAILERIGLHVPRQRGKAPKRVDYGEHGP